jgi:hypothetical protein
MGLSFLCSCNWCLWTHPWLTVEGCELSGGIGQLPVLKGASTSACLIQWKAGKFDRNKNAYAALFCSLAYLRSPKTDRAPGPRRLRLKHNLQVWIWCWDFSITQLSTADSQPLGRKKCLLFQHWVLMVCYTVSLLYLLIHYLNRKYIVEQT